MAIACPHCGNKFVLKAEPGVYQPACPECSLSFVLVVPRKEGQAPITAKSMEAMKELKAKAARRAAEAGKQTIAETDTGWSAARQSKDASEAATIVESEDATLMGETMAETDQSIVPVNDDDNWSGESIGKLDGYELLKELGRGGMGSVYLARQLSLNRQVAVKTIHPHLSNDASFLARFVREAFAVAQLSHHNVVQIYDVGQDELTHYFSMELVPGRSLEEVVAQTGPLEPRAATTYILHAARGLAFAHEHRMVHRDVKPANLLLSDSGLVKVADLGLVKTDQQVNEAAARSEALSGRHALGDAASRRSTSQRIDVSIASKIMGTPAYMAPEQAKDSTKVDARADIYALGGTLYFLVTGKHPYPGKTVEELIRNHRKMPLVPPTKHNPRLPASLSAFIEKMLAKDPAKRPQTMADVVQSIEGMLNIAAGPFTPRPEHVNAVSSAADQLRAVTPAKIKRGLIVAFHAGCLLLFVLGIAASSLALVSSAVVLWVVTILSYLITFGTFNRDELLRRCRRFALGVGWQQWVIAGGGVVSFSVMMVAIGMQWSYLGAMAGGVILGMGFYFTVERWVAKALARCVMPVETMLSELRRNGSEEQSLRQFVCRYAGRRWEQLYEMLFGYDEKLEARRLWGYDDQGNPRPHYAGYRDLIIARLDRVEEERANEHVRQHIQRMEMQRMRAEGIEDVKAMAEARQIAREFADNAARYKETKRPKSLAEAYHNQTFADEVSDKSLEEIPASWKLVPTPWSTVLMYWIFGARGRFIVGSLILLGWAMWAVRSHAFPTLPEKSSYLEHLRTFIAHRPAPLSLPGVPPAILDVVSTPGAMFAGLLVMVSGMFQGLRMTIFLLPIVIMLLRAPFMSTATTHYLSPLEWTFLIALLLTPPGIIFGRVRY
jgi:serine/threonine protein kinase/DNA-directed RNA polymerase subunit RPC12/RpoP